MRFIASSIVGAICAVALLATGFKLGIDHQKATDADRRDQIEQAGQAAALASAKAIAAIRVNHTTIRQKVQHETSIQPVYGGCRHTADGLRWTNAVLTGAFAAGERELPAPDAAAR